MIPNEIIDRILDKVDIIEIISAYVPLKRAGQSFKACCPFHEEKTPSFVVSSGKQIYHCFGCGAGGNAISFLMKHEKMDFIESIKMLADKAGVALPYYGRNEREKNTFADKLFGVNNLACAFYGENLASESGKNAREYFEKRGIHEKTVKFFRLGLAGNSWYGLVNRLKEEAIDADIPEKAGLILRNNQNANLYDRFRNRVIFPIFDMRGKVLGFGARSMDNSLPKYINSPETHIYRKGTHLYGLNFSKESIRKQNYAIIVEGYFDLILPYQNGIRNIAATLGTALTREQIAGLRRFTKNVIMIYDSDKAGEEATLRSLDILIGEDMNVRMAILPKGADPDSFVQSEGKAGFMKILKESKDLFDYKLDILTSRFRKDDPRGKARITEGMLPTMARIKNTVLKSAYLKKLSEKLSVDEESVRAELKKIRPGFPETYRTRAYEENRKSSANAAEIALLAVVLEDTGRIERIEKELGLASFKDGSIACILRKISEFHKSGRKVTPSHLMSSFEDAAKERIISEAVTLGHTIGEKEKAMEDCFNHIRKHALKKTLSDIRFKIMDADSRADAEKVNSLIAEYGELIKGINTRD